MKRRTFCIGCLFAAVSPAFAAVSGTPIRATLYKNPECTCCEGYASYLRSNRFEVDVKPTNDLNQISEKAGVPEKYQGCHTMFVGGYVVDGHVPMEVVRKLRSFSTNSEVICCSSAPRSEDRDLGGTACQMSHPSAPAITNSEGAIAKRIVIGLPVRAVLANGRSLLGS